MKKLILQCLKKDKAVPGENEYGYFPLNKPKKEMADLYIVYEVLYGLLDQSEWAEIDIFANDFKGFSSDCVSLDKSNDRFYMSYAFESLPRSQDLSFSILELQSLLNVWRRLIVRQPNYIIFLQLESGQFFLEGKESLSEDELRFVHE
ncbi:MAG: hypothetical protein NTU89_03955 [Candidatus Dependentiae bacterium]|nr:hypothetical protein [Candidatus Dependentiae bacterium]